jgi:5-(carboxyamino)imidazole ribonucleotide mutase
MMKVAILMGSDSDLAIMANAAAALEKLEVPCEMHVMSAHRTPAAAMGFASNAKENGFGAIIAGAGMAAHLAGVIAAHTTLPVIGVPIVSKLNGLDALLSTAQMPPGIPVATVATDGAYNAGVLAAQILALSDPALAERLVNFKKAMEDAVIAKDKELNEIGYKNYLSKNTK